PRRPRLHAGRDAAQDPDALPSRHTRRRHLVPRTILQRIVGRVAAAYPLQKQVETADRARLSASATRALRLARSISAGHPPPRLRPTFARLLLDVECTYQT